nr:putative clathrin assembly protein At1g03050 [Ipomoea batatas]GME12632.1 putative clathrin assembly protein At1g03050 [Ipomoea batatas]GME12635.1 putative clathrin assembly protein At1g03050 [Ipomoea batatas]GME13738.1 putative clathrin assembly protein At1g03050 [Ipomoea batatas]
MAPSKLRKAIGAMKDQTSIHLAKVSGNDDSVADLEVAIVKATSHEDFPADERHVREILTLTCHSPAHVAACVSAISRRLSKTRDWVVALKALMLIHRLLTHGDMAYEQEVFFATRRGTRLLNMSDFRDGGASRSESWDFSAFVRTIHHYAHILDRFLACKPTGGARNSRMVLVALYPVVKESFVIYFDMAELMGILIDRFMELTIPDSIKVHEIFCKVAKQFEELQMFYNWCKATGIARSSEYPDPSEDFFNPREEVEPEKKGQDIGDLLNLGEDAPTAEEHANQLALALFQGGSTAAETTTASPWEAFSDSGDWETTLVQSASHLSNQTAQFPGGFDMLLLDGMYQQGTINHAVASSGATGSSSSVAFGSAGRPAMLALPAPTSGAAYTAQGMDPFAASLSIPPPAYVQMSEIERKQRLLMEEQLMWHQYTRDGMQGQAGFANVHQPNIYPYTRTF